jgi:hypothetical protein
MRNRYDTRYNPVLLFDRMASRLAKIGRASALMTAFPHVPVLCEGARRSNPDPRLVLDCFVPRNDEWAVFSFACTSVHTRHCERSEAIQDHTGAGLPRRYAPRDDEAHIQ